MHTMILLNGGVGSRFGGVEPKQLMRIKQVPMFIYVLRIVVRSPEINRIVSNYPKGWLPVFRSLLNDYGMGDKVEFVEAGASRQESVYKMLEVAMDDNNKSIIIHEAARPLIQMDDFSKLINHVDNNVSFGVQIPFTVLRLNALRDTIVENCDRDSLVNVQLPQKFNKNQLWEAHCKAKREGIEFTEDASLAHHFGENVKFIEGSSRNIKITEPNDRTMATLLLDMESEDV